MNGRALYRDYANSTGKDCKEFVSLEQDWDGFQILTYRDSEGAEHSTHIQDRDILNWCISHRPNKKSTQSKPILALIKSIRDSSKQAVMIYTQGSCWHLYNILKQVYPMAEPYYDSDHIITKIGDNFYDINGIFENKKHTHLSGYPAAVNFFESGHAFDFKLNKMYTNKV